MAKVDAGMLSFGATGTIGKTMTFSSWKGRPYVRRRVIPSNPKTGGQVGVRAGLKWGSRFWKFMDGLDQATFEAPAATKAVSPFNVFISQGQSNIANLKGYAATYQPAPATALDPPTPVSATVSLRTVTLAYSPNPDADNFGNYIYRGLVTGFTPSPSNLIAITDPTADHYSDVPGQAGTYFYVIVTDNKTGVLGDPSVEVTAVVT